MTNSKKTLGVIAIILIYIAIAIVGFFIVYFIKSAITKPSTVATAPKTTPVPVPSGYAEYKNTQQKFAVSYPSDMQKKETSYGLGVSAVEFRAQDNTDPTYAPDIQMLTVPKTIAKAAGQDFDAYYAMADNATTIIKSPVGKDTAEKFTKIRNHSVNGLKAVDYKSLPTTNPDNQEAEIGTFIDTGSTITILSTGESNQKGLETMLQTFTYPL